MQFSDLKHFLNPIDSKISLDGSINQLVIDTRSSDFYKNALFFALKTNKRDGHKYAKDAYAKGIRNFIVQDPDTVNFADDLNYIQVDNCLRSLQEIASQKRKNYNYPIIAITGSNGKTIIKEWLSQVLSRKYNLVKSPKSYNSQIGVPLSVWQLENRYNLGIFEAGISQKGEMDKLHSIIQPSIGILSNIGSAHDEGFASREEKLQEKLYLFKDCEKLILRAEELRSCQKFQKELNIAELISWGNGKENKYQLSHSRHSGNSSIRINDFEFFIHFADKASIENISHVIVASLELGLSNQEIQEGINQLSNLAMRLEVKAGENDCVLIDDTYNHDEAGLKVAIEYLVSQYKNYDKSIIISDLKQSGLRPESQIELIKTLLENLKLKHKILIGAVFSDFSGSFGNDFSVFRTIDEFLKKMPDFKSELILIKGSRQMKFERIVKRLEKQIHGTRLEINLSNIAHNLDYFRSQLNSGTKLMVMVKAFAYGAGSREVANLLQFSQVDYLGVAYANEGVELRKLGVNLPIFVMNPSSESLSLCFDYNLEPEIFSFSSLNTFISESKIHKNNLAIHLNIDTGMNRLGFELEEIEKLGEIIKKENIKVASIFSHLSSSDDLKEKNFTLDQIEKFNLAFDDLCRITSLRPMKHILNSAGIINYPEHQYDMVRLGIGLYGVNNGAIPSNPLMPIGRLVSEISQIKKIDAEDSIGYSRKGKLTKGGKIATIPIGYADGFSRIFSNGRGKVNINGQLAPVIGNVCMDMIMVDITEIQASEGDEVIIFGDEPNVLQLAEWSDTIPYEILTNISERVKRVYIND